MSERAILTTHGLGKRFRIPVGRDEGPRFPLWRRPTQEHWAVRDVSLAVEPGEYGLDLLYYQGADTEGGLTLSWAKDGGAKAPIPPQAFFPPENLADIAAGNEAAGG